MYMEGENVPSTEDPIQHSSNIITEQKRFTQPTPIPKSPIRTTTIQTPKQSPILQSQQIHQHQILTSINETTPNQTPQQFTQILNQNTLQKLQSHEFTLSQNEISNLISFPSQIGSIQISAISADNAKNLQKSVMVQQQNQQNFGSNQPPAGLNVVRELGQNNLTTIPSQIGNIQISQICGGQQGQGGGGMLGVQQHGTSQASSIIVQNSNPVQANDSGQIHNLQSLGGSGQGVQTQSGGNAPLGGFKLAMSEDGRILLQHDRNLHQDLQSQLLLQHIFGLVSVTGSYSWFRREFQEKFVGNFEAKNITYRGITEANTLTIDS